MTYFSPHFKPNHVGEISGQLRERLKVQTEKGRQLYKFSHIEPLPKNCQGLSPQYGYSITSRGLIQPNLFLYCR